MDKIRLLWLVYTQFVSLKEMRFRRQMKDEVDVTQRDDVDETQKHTTSATREDNDVCVNKVTLV